MTLHGTAMARETARAIAKAIDADPACRLRSPRRGPELATASRTDGTDRGPAISRLVMAELQRRSPTAIAAPPLS
jgi:hypothetical protein